MTLPKEFSDEEMRNILDADFTFISPQQMSPEEENRLRKLADHGNKDIRTLLSHIYWMRQEESQAYHKHFFAEKIQNTKSFLF